MRTGVSITAVSPRFYINFCLNIYHRSFSRSCGIPNNMIVNLWTLSWLQHEKFTSEARSPHKSFIPNNFHSVSVFVAYTHESLETFLIFSLTSKYPVVAQNPHTTDLNIDARQRELPTRLVVPRHVSEELLAVLVPLDGVQHVSGAQCPAARQGRARAQCNVRRHAQFQQLKACDSVLCGQKNLIRTIDLVSLTQSGQLVDLCPLIDQTESHCFRS